MMVKVVESVRSRVDRVCSVVLEWHSFSPVVIFKIYTVSKWDMAVFDTLEKTDNRRYQQDNGEYLKYLQLSLTHNHIKLILQFSLCVIVHTVWYYWTILLSVENIFRA